MSREAAKDDDNRRFAIVAILAAVVCFGALYLLPKLARGANEGVAAENFVLPVAANGDDGARISLQDLKGKPVLLDFWASWCGPCAMQAPILERMSKKYADKGLVVLGVNVDDSVDVTRAYALRKGLSYPMLVDDDSSVQRAYGVKRLPSLVLIDREGKVVSYTTGMVDESSLDAMVREAL